MDGLDPPYLVPTHLGEGQPIGPIPAEDLETLSDRCAGLEASLWRIGLPMEQITSTLPDKSPNNSVGDGDNQTSSAVS